MPDETFCWLADRRMAREYIVEEEEMLMDGGGPELVHYKREVRFISQPNNSTRPSMMRTNYDTISEQGIRLPWI